jgi:glycosyltransferase involved in cell wall biosynthesis
MMHLAFVSTYYYPRMRGGAEHSLQHHAETLVQRGARVSVFSLHEGAKPERFTHRGVECHALPAPQLGRVLDTRQRAPAALRAAWHILDVYNPAAGRLLETELRRIQPDLVQTENLPGWTCAAWTAARRYGRPHLQMLHDYQLTCPAATRFRVGVNCTRTCVSCRPFAALRQRFSRSVRHVVANSRYTRGLHQSLGFFPRAASFDVIYGAVPQGHPVEPPARPDGRLRIGYLGRLHATKGVRLLIEAFARAGRADAVLRIAGTGDPEEETLLREAARGQAVEFLGHAPASEFLAGLDVLVAPSLWHEPMGRVVIEAAGQGVPVIAAARGGIPELLIEGRTGWTFDPDRIEALVERLRGLDRSVLAGMRADCRRFAEPFGPEPIAARWLELYGRLLATPARAEASEPAAVPLAAGGELVAK